MGLDRPIDVTADQRKTLLALLKRHLPNTTAWVYGSRVKWTSRPQSDLDLVVFTTPDQERRVSDLREAFEESNLPFRVDLFVWDAVPEQFRKQIEAEHVVLVERGEQGIAGEWQERRWGDLATLEYGRALRGYDTPEGMFRVFGTNGPIGWHDEALYAHPGVIVGRKGAYRGIHYSAEPFFVIDTAFYLKPKVEMDVRWAYYELLTQDINLMDSGSAIPSTSREEFYSLPVSVPPPSEQRAIAHVLGTLDDKIELNRRMNETLEAMARALFKSWFIDFDPVRAKAALRNHSPLEGESAKAPSGITPPLRGSRRDKGASTQMSRWGAIKRFYTQQTLQKAQTLRESQTNAEGLLWHYLRDKQLAGYKFRRQQPIGPYIVDFACMPKKLLIELDGGQHAEQHTYDKKRDEFLREKGYKILRFWNNDVFENCFGVLESIRATVQDPPPQQSAPKGLTTATPPQGGSDWSVERARAYLDRMPQHLADLFPDRLVDSELGPIPEGWEVGTLERFISLNPESWSRENIPCEIEYVDLANTKKGVINSTQYFLKKDAPSRAKRVLRTGDTIVGTVRPGNGSYAMIGKDGLTGSTGFAVLRPKHPTCREFVYLAATGPENVERLTHLADGAAYPAVRPDAVSATESVVPDDAVLGCFSRVVAPVFDKIGMQMEGFLALEALRDTLLPKLISSELRISNVSTEMIQ